MGEAVNEKHRGLNLWKTGDGRATCYNTAKQASKCAVHQTRRETEKIALQKIDSRSADIYHLAKQM